MRIWLKFIVMFAILCGFIFESSFMFINNITFQLLSLAVILIACLVRFGFTKIITELRLFLPFICTMMIVYVIMGLAGFRVYDKAFSGHSVLQYWLVYGITRTILFLSTMLFLQLLLSYISICDILSLSMHINKKRYLLLGRTLFVHSIKYIEELKFHLKLMPEFQVNRMSFRQWLRIKFQLSLSVIMMILRESMLKGELIDNRIRHCFPSKQE